MRQALEHLIVRHGCRRIAFIRGPPVNAEAERRYAIYRAVLEERGLPFDPALVCEGTFEKRRRRSGRRATLVDERRVQFDAPGGRQRLHGAGRDARARGARAARSPSDVAVVGFDDIEDARFSTPPLTTVRQPLYQQGEAALELVLAQLEGAPGRAATTARHRAGRAPVVRLPLGPGAAGPRRPRHHDARRRSTACWPSTATTSHARDRARGARRRHALPPGWDRQLLDAFEAELRGAGAGLFASTLDRLLASVAPPGDDVGGLAAR